MENVELNNLDTIVRIVDLVSNFLNHVTSDSEIDFMKLKSQLDREYKTFTVKNLEIELRNVFLKMNDSMSQNNFGLDVIQKYSQPKPTQVTGLKLSQLLTLK